MGLSDRFQRIRAAVANRVFARRRLTEYGAKRHKFYMQKKVKRAYESRFCTPRAIARKMARIPFGPTSRAMLGPLATRIQRAFKRRLVHRKLAGAACLRRRYLPADVIGHIGSYL